MAEEQTVFIQTPHIRLDALMKFSGIAQTGGEAKMMIQAGEVSVNGEISHMRGKKCQPGDRIEVSGVRISIAKG